jgi:DnaJ-class molecular chaperone
MPCSIHGDVWCCCPWPYTYTSPRQAERKPHKCPVCDGNGKKPNPHATGENDLLPCHACDGKGIVWEPTT